MDKVTRAFCKAHGLSEDLYYAKLRRNRYSTSHTLYYLWWTIFKYKKDEQSRERSSEST